MDRPSFHLGYHQVAERFAAQRELPVAEALILQAVWYRTAAKDKPSAIIARQALANQCSLSDRGTKLALDRLVSKGLVDRRYVCACCGAGLGMAFGDITIGRCPSCGTHLFKNVAVEMKLSTRGNALLPLLGVLNSSIQERDSDPIPQASLEWAFRAAQVLGVSNPLQVEALARLHASSRYTAIEWELALAVAAESYRQHASKPVLNLVALMRWALAESAKRRPQNEGSATVPIADPFLKSRLEWSLDNLGRLERQADRPQVSKDVERLIAVVTINEAIHEQPELAAAVDLLCEVRGRQPRTLIAMRKLEPEEAVS